jgi:hypothetical protein
MAAAKHRLAAAAGTNERSRGSGYWLNRKSRLLLRGTFQGVLRTIG